MAVPENVHSECENAISVLDVCIAVIDYLAHDDPKLDSDLQPTVAGIETCLRIVSDKLYLVRDALDGVSD